MHLHVLLPLRLPLPIGNIDLALASADTRGFGVSLYVVYVRANFAEIKDQSRLSQPGIPDEPIHAQLKVLSKRKNQRKLRNKKKLKKI